MGLLLAAAGLLAVETAIVASWRRPVRPHVRAVVPPPGGGERGVPGGVLRVGLAEDVDSLDPQLAARPSSWFFMRALHRGLMAYPASGSAPSSSGRPVPDLAAAAPAVSADGLAYTFRLRDGTRFGPPASRAVTAADVRAGIERLLRSGSDLARSLDVVRAVTTPDARTVTVTLERPANDLPWILALPQASAVPAEIAGTFGLAGVRVAPSGPYRIADYTPERRVRLVRNPAWRAAADPVRAAWVDEIDATIGARQAEMDSAIASGSLDMQADSPSPEAVAAQGAGNSSPNGCLRYVWMNTTVTPFDRVDARRAVALALDGRGAAASGAHGDPATGILPPTVAGSSAGVPGTDVSIDADPAAARRALSSAGYPRGFSSRLVVGDTPADRAQAGAVQRSLAAAGIRVAVQPAPIATLYSDLYERPASRVPMGLATWCADWPGLGGRSVIGALLDYRRIRPEGNTVYSMLRSAVVARRIDAAVAAASEQDAALRWRDADRTALATAAVVPIAWLRELVALNERVRGFRAHPFFVRGDPTALWLER